MIGRLLAWVTLVWIGLAPHAQAYDVVDRELEGRAFERLKVNVGGFLQPRFRFTPSDDNAGTPGEIGFSLQRVRVLIGGDLLPPSHRRFGFFIRQRFQFELIPEPSLLDAYIDVGFGTEFQIRLGQFKAPVHRALLVSDANNLFADRNQITRWITDREMGIMFHGYWGQRYIQWQAAMFNGEGANRLSNVNNKFYYAARITFSPLGSPGDSYEILLDWKPEGREKFVPVFTVGYAFHANTDGPLGQQQARLAHNVEFFFHWRFLTVMSELHYATIDWEAPEIEDFTQLGGYVQFGAFLYGVPWAQRHLALMGRFEQGDRFIPTDAANVPVTGATDPSQGSRRYSIGLGIFAGEPLFDVVQDFRLIVSYTIKQELEGFSYDNDELNITASMRF